MTHADRLRQFGQRHAVQGARVLHVEDGELWYAATAKDIWGITWYPHRADHPDAPEFATDSVSEGIDGTGGADAFGERVRAHFAGRDPRQLIHVLIEQEASPLQIEAVQRTFDEAGAPAIVSASYGRYSAVHTTWIVLVQASLVTFAGGLAAKAGADTWDALRHFVQRLYEERRKLGHDRGTLEIDEGPRRIRFDETIPPEAYEALAELSVEGDYHWDRDSATWRKL